MDDRATQPVEAALRRARGQRHLPGLDGLRAIAALLVLALHTGLFPGQGGVLVFFVLSGFLITWVMLEEEARAGHVSLRRFWVRRALRIFPVFYVFWVVQLALNDLPGLHASDGQRWSAFLYVSDYYQAVTGDVRGALTHTWSLGIEEKFYLLWPLAFLALRSSRARMLGLAAVIAAATGWRLLVTLSWQDPAWAYYAFETRADQLALGCLAAVALHAGHGDRLWALLCGGRWRVLLPVVLFLGTTVACMGPDHRQRALFGFTLQALATAWILVHGLVWSGQGPLGWLEARPVAALGRISYSIYLWQLVGIGLTRVLFPGLSRGAFVAAAWGVVLAISVASYLAIERPSLALKRRLAP